MSEYTEEFFKMLIKSERDEDEEELTTRYINGLIFSIQDEMTTRRMMTMDEAYQLALRIEEKLAQQPRKRPYVRYSHVGGWKQCRGASRWLAERRSMVADLHLQCEVRYRPMRGGGSSSARGRGRFLRNYHGRTNGVQRTFSKSVKCYTYGEDDHFSWDCLTRSKGDARQEA